MQEVKDKKEIDATRMSELQLTVRLKARSALKSTEVQQFVRDNISCIFFNRVISSPSVSLSVLSVCVRHEVVRTNVTLQLQLLDPVCAYRS